MIQLSQTNNTKLNLIFLYCEQTVATVYFLNFMSCSLSAADRRENARSVQEDLS